MGNGGQWGMADNWEWQTMGDENILETTDTGEWQYNGEECQMMNDDIIPCGWNEAYSKSFADGDFSSIILHIV